ncbi:MAG: SPOR domain-containing protein [Gallionella sp.]
MRNLFWILLLGNVFLFAAIQRGWLVLGEPEIPAQPSLHADMIRLLPPLAVPVLPAPAPVSASPAQTSSASQTSSNRQPSRNIAANMVAPPTAQPGAPVCLEWGDFSGPDLARAATALSALHLADQLSQRQIERDISYWVYIPPLRNKAAANRKIAELRALRVREYFVMQTSGPWLNAISLGVFKTRDAAQNFLHNLQAKGVRSAQVGERGSKVKATLFLLNKIDAATEIKLSALQKDFAGSELNHVPCTLTSAH